MDSPEINRTIRVRTDQREEAHVRSFTRWINAKLSKIRTKVEISDLYNDLRDGHVLISLLEVLMHDKLPREKGKLRVHHATNVDIVLKTLEREKIKLHGISGEAIVNGNPKSTLGLVWTIILHYQVHGVMQEEAQQASHVAKKEEKPARKMSEAAGEDRLLRWVQDSIEGYDDVIEVKDLSKSWRNGMAFSVLIHVHRNDLIKLEEVDKMSNTDRLEHAFDIAEEHLNVERLLEPSDVDQANPDKKLVMMYVSTLSEALRQYEPVKRAKRRKVVEETMVATASSSVESSVPEPSEPFLQFKESLVQTSTLLQKTESDYAILEKKFENRIDFEAWENFEHEFKSLASEVENLEEQGRTVSRDSRVSSSEADEVRSDVIALETRWSSFTTRTQVQRNRIISIQNNEEKELQEWRKQMEIYLDWVENIRENFDKVEAMKSQSNVVILGEQAQELKRLGQALNTDQVPRQTFEHGRRLLTRNILSAKKQTDVKEKLIDLEKQLDGLNTRASKDIDRLNKNIDFMKQTQADQMGKWHQQAELMCDWMDDMDDKLEALDAEDGNKDTKNISKHLQECENLQEEIKGDEKPHSIMDHGEALVTENILSKDQKAKIEKQLKEIENEWRKLLEKAAEIKARLTSRREACELEEKHKVEEWIRKFEILMKQLTKVKETVARSATLPDFGERCETFQECQEVVETIRPDYQNAVECADKVLLYEACPDWEKTQIKEDVNMLTTAWKNVLDDISAEKKSMDEIQAEAANEQIMKIHKWQEKYNEVDKWYKNMSTKIEGEFTMGKTLPVVRGQITEHEALLNRMVSTHESVEDLLSTGQELLQNANTPDAEKNKLRKDIANLVERWESLSGPVNKRMERLSEMEKHLQENLSGKLDEWINQATYVEGCLTKAEKKFQSMGVIAPNLEAAMKQKPRAEALLKEVKQEEKKLNSALRVGEEILADASMSDQDNAKLQQELNTLKNRWEALDEKISWRVKRLDETISRLGSQQNDKLEKWRESASEISDWLDKAQLRLAERGPIGSDLKSVTLQKEEFQVFLDESLLFQRHIYEFTEFGENLRTDPCISEEERVRVQQKTKSLNERWDVIVQQINNHHNALEEQLEDLEEEHIAELLGRWEEKYGPFSVWLSSVENEVNSLKDLGDNAVVVRKQQKETENLISKVANHEPIFKEVLSVVHAVNNDPLIEDDEAKAIDKLADSLISRWGAVNDTIMTRAESLRIRESFLNEQEQHLLHEWRRSVEPFNNWLSNVEEDGALKLRGNVGVNTIKDYSVRFKTLEREIEGRKPVLEEIERLGRKLLEDPTVRDEEKSHIKEEMEILKERWEKLHVTIHDNTKWADIKLIELAKKEQETLDVWRKNVEPFNTWLEETSFKLEDIKTDWTSTENLKDKHLALQKIKEDVTRHEEALARIVTIADKLTDDENVSENEKGNIKAEMNRLQDKWNTTQNNVNLNYLSVTESLMELAQKERETLEQWKKQTDSFKEWVVEAKGRFDNALRPGEGYDVVSEQKEKLENLSRELAEKEKDFGDICELKTTILQDDHLSSSFKDNIKTEAESLDQKWNELRESISLQSDRAQKQMISLEGSQRTKLDKWQNDFRILNTQQNETEDQLKTFETLPLDVDNAKKQCADLKVVEQKIEINRSRMEEVSSFCAEIAADPNVSKKEKTRIKKDIDMVKERQSRQERTVVDRQRRLDSQVRELQDRQSAKLENWRTSSQPLHEWLDGIEDDAREYDVMLGSIVDAQVQFDELQKLSKEFKETEPDLFNVLKLGEELSTDPQVSEDVREGVSQDVKSLRENHGNVSELIKSQREKTKSQLLKLRQHQEKCLIDWNQRKSSIDARIKTMEKRTRHLQPVGDNFEDVQAQKDEIKTTEKELESIEWELTTVLEYGQTLCKDKSIIDGEKEEIRAEMKTMETALYNSRENVEQRKLDLNSKLEQLRKARANEFLTKWRKSSSAVTKWMDTCQEGMAVEVDDSLSLAAVRERLDDIDELSDKVEAFEPEFSSAVKDGEDVIKEPSVEASDKEQVENQLLELKERWKKFNVNLDSLMSSLEDHEMDLSKGHDQESKRWHNDVQQMRDWCRETETRLQQLDNADGHSNYEDLSTNRKELQVIAEMLPKHEVKLKELEETSEQLSRDSKDKSESENYKQEIEGLQNDFDGVKQTVESLKSNYDVVIGNLESEHGQKLSEWNKRDERIERQLVNIERQWQDVSHLENASEDQMQSQRPQLEAIVSDLNDLQPDFDRHISSGRQLSNNTALSSETRTMVQDKLSAYSSRWETLQIPKRLLSHLPRVAVVENVVKIEDSKQVESIDDAFDDLFGIENDGPVCQELIDWYVEYDAVLKWCVDAETRIERLRTPGEYIVLVEKQHGEIEETIQTFTAYEITVSKVLDKGNQILSEQDMLSKDDIGRLEDDIRLLKTKWDDLQEKAFDTERSLNEHVNKLQEYQDWREKASALSQWLEMTHRKMDCCSTPSDDLEEREKQRIFLQKFSMEKHQNEESIKDVLNLGRYIVTNHLVLKEKYDEVNADVKRFKNIWNQMLSKADDFCKIFGIEFSHIDLDSSDPLEQWREKVKELEKWLVAANEKLNLKRNLKDYSVLKQLPEDAKDISQGIDNYCVPQLNEITSKGQDILNSKKCKPKQNAEIADTIASLSEKLNALRVFTESQKVHVRNATLAYFNKKLNASESTVESVLENLKKLKTVGTQAAAVKDQVDLIKNSEEHLQQHVLGFEEYKKQLLEMEDKGYLSSDGFEGTLKVKTAELEPKLMAVEKQFADTKNRLAKGVVNFHGQHKDEVKKWLKICEKKLNEIDSDADDINRIYEEYCKIQELRREMMKGEKDFLNTLELNERLIAEEILNEKQGKEYQAEIQSVAKWRNSLQRRVQEKDSRLYVSLVEGLNAMLMSSIHSFEEVESTFNEQQLSPDFDTATEQMDATKHIVENTENLKRKARGTLELSQKITTMGILLLKESDKGDVEDKVKQLMEYCSTLPGKARDKFNRLLDDYLVLFKKEIEDRKNWIAVNENKMSSSYMEIENLARFEDELKEHKEFEQELNNRNMEKMSDAAERVPELERHLKIEVRNITKRSNVLKQWADDYSLDLQRVVKDWNSIQQRQKALTSWLDPQEERLSKLNEKINCIDREGVGQEIQDLKDFQSELEEQGVVLSKIHVKGMELMKFLNDEAAASRTIDQELAQLDRRWNAMAKELLARIELLRNIELKQGDIKQQKEIVNKYIDETNTELDEHETKTQRLRGNVSQETIVENGETAREKKVRLKKEREFDQQELNQLVKNLEEKVANFPNYQSRVDRINSLSRDLEDVADDDSKASLHEELVTFNARWQVIVTRLEAYSDNDLPDHTSWGCMGFVRRRLSSATL